MRKIIILVALGISLVGNGLAACDVGEDRPGYGNPGGMVEVVPQEIDTGNEDTGNEDTEEEGAVEEASNMGTVDKGDTNKEIEKEDAEEEGPPG